MNDYKELIDQVRTCIARGCDCCNQESTCKYDLTCNGIFDYHLACADAIEQLVRERDAAVADAKEFRECCSCPHRCFNQGGVQDE